MTLLRLFAAFEMPAAVRNWAAELPGRLGPRWQRGGRWEPPEKLHVTVKFFGGLPSEKLSAVEQLLAAAASSTAPLTLMVAEQLGGFPSGPPGRTLRVLWASVYEPTGRLTRLAELLDQSAVAVGVQRETRPYHAHITLARLTGGFTAASLAVLPPSAAARPAFTVDATELVLFQSLLGPGRSVYKQISRHGLA